MKVIKYMFPVLALSLTAASAAEPTVRVYPVPSVSNLELGLTGGSYNGLGGQAYIGMRNLAGPIGARLSASYGRNSGGFDESADYPLFGSIGQMKATGLVTATSSRSTTVGLDATYNLGYVADNIDTTVYGGLRYGTFNSRLEMDSAYTDYSSSAFGLGAGVEAGYKINSNLSITGNLGADYYFNGGDVTASSSDGSRNMLAASSADFVNRPGMLVKAGVGIKYLF